MIYMHIITHSFFINVCYQLHLIMFVYTVFIVCFLLIINTICLFRQSHNSRSLYYTLYIYIIILGGFACFVEWGVRILSQQQTSLNHHYYSVQDMQGCPEYVAYLTHFQSMFGTYPYAMAVAGANSLILFALLACVHMCIPSLHLNVALLVCIIVFLSTFIWIYKMMNCVLGRMCGQEYCSKRFFKNK